MTYVAAVWPALNLRSRGLRPLSEPTVASRARRPGRRGSSTSPATSAPARDEVQRQCRRRALPVVSEAEAAEGCHDEEESHPPVPQALDWLEATHERGPLCRPKARFLVDRQGHTTFRA